MIDTDDEVKKALNYLVGYGYLHKKYYTEVLIKEVKRLRSEPTVTVDDYHKRGDLYVTVRFPDGEQYVGLVEKQEGEEE